jgi:hypothetical protein
MGKFPPERQRRHCCVMVAKPKFGYHHPRSVSSIAMPHQLVQVCSLAQPFLAFGFLLLLYQHRQDLDGWVETERVGSSPPFDSRNPSAGSVL